MKGKRLTSFFRAITVRLVCLLDTFPLLIATYRSPDRDRDHHFRRENQPFVASPETEVVAITLAAAASCNECLYRLLQEHPYSTECS